MSRQPALLAAAVLLLASSVTANTYSVTNTSDSGPGSLRQAILDGNGHAGLDTIAFAAGSGPIKIVTASQLPTVSDPVVLDGTTQPGFAGTPIVEIDNNALYVTGGALRITGGGTTIRGLVFNRFSYEGIHIDGGGNNVIAGNYIGIDATGTVSTGHSNAPPYQTYGIIVSNSSNNTIGGTTVADRNVIAGTSYAIDLRTGAAATTISGNYIGTDVTGTVAIGNGAGIYLDGAGSATIGGAAAGARNVISANNNGIYSSAATGALTIRGNYIGVDATGNAPLPNGFGAVIYPPTWDGSNPGGPATVVGNVISANTGDGIDLDIANCTLRGNLIGVGANGSTPLGNGWFGVSFVQAAGLPTNHIVGGTAPGDANIIANNKKVGIEVGGRIYKNRISGNSIYNNGLGIALFDGNSPAPHDNDAGDVDDGPNHMQNWPEITSVTTGPGNTTIDGFLEAGGSGTYTLEFFSNPACNASGFGEGKTFLGTVALSATGTGRNAFHAAFAIDTTGLTITATATDAAGNTSELSRCYTPGGLLLFNTATYNAAEGTPAVTLTVTRRGALPALTVDYYTIDGSAVAGSDYTAVAATLSFAAGEASKSFTIPILDDAVYDPGESFSVGLRNATGAASIITPATATVFVAENDPIGGSPNILVTNTNDSGPGSLRQAILDANAHAGRDYIGFAIGSGPQTINVNSTLPEITDPVIIDGTTQPGFSGHPIVELVGQATQTNRVDGFYVKAGGSTIRGLAMHHFTLTIVLQTGGGNVVAGNYLGLTPNGESSIPGWDPDTANQLYSWWNFTAITIWDGSTGNRIGGSTAADRNVIAAHQTGIFVEGDHSDGLIIEGNYFGTNAAGTGSIGISVAINTYSSSVVRRNVVAAATVGIWSGGDASVFQGNLVGLDATGHTVMPISWEGINIIRGSAVLVGGTSPDDRNVVGGARTGLLINASNATVQGNYVGTDVAGNLTGVTIDGIIVRPDIYMAGNADGDVISGNVITGSNTALWIANARNTVVTDNKIGVGPDGVTALAPGSGNGIFQVGEDVTIGTPGHGNVVAHFRYGIYTGRPALVRANSTYGNSAGSFAYFPYAFDALTISALTNVAGQTHVRGNLIATLAPSTPFIIDFFSNSTSVTDGQRWMGSVAVTTDPSGKAPVDAMFADIGGFLTYTITNAKLSLTEGFNVSLPIARPGMVELDAPSYQVAEDGGAVTVTLVRHDGSEGSTTVVYATANGSAIAGSDYTATSGSVTFAAGETSKQVVIPIRDDRFNEPAESFTFTLTGVTAGNAALGPVSSATITIDDDDPAVITFNDTSAFEGDSGTSSVAVQVSISNPSTHTVSVHWQTADGSAKAGEDYQPASGTLEFAPGETRKTIAVKIIGDTVSEPDEIFGIAFSQPVNGVLERPRAVVKIVNDDARYRTLFDVEYGRADGQPLYANLYLPKNAERPAPVVIWLHDGDWTSGLRAPAPAVHEAERGYAVVAVDYRLAPASHFPAPAADVKTAIRWVRANAAQYNFDASRIALWGAGAGGHLAALAGLTADVASLDNTIDANLGELARVSAVIDWNGASDLTSLAAAIGCDGNARDAIHSPEAQLLGCSVASCPTTAASASPVSYVTPDDPPFLIMHALTNCAIPASQSQELAEALAAKGVAAKLVLFGSEAEAPGFWEDGAVLSAVDEFLDVNLGGARRRAAGR